MEFFKPRNIFLKLVCVSGLTLILYGYLSRLAGIYFFWESKSLGWFLLFIALIGLIQERIKRRKARNPEYKGYAEKCGILVAIFSLLLKITVFFLVSSSEVLTDAKTFLLNDSTTIAELGNIKSFSVVPWGGMNRQTNSTDGYRSATIILILKGEKKYRQLTISLTKQIDQKAWKVVRMDGLED